MYWKLCYEKTISKQWKKWKNNETMNKNNEKTCANNQPINWFLNFCTIGIGIEIVLRSNAIWYATHYMIQYLVALGHPRGQKTYHGHVRKWFLVNLNIFFFTTNSEC
jgi:hypothetical protein